MNKYKKIVKQLKLSFDESRDPRKKIESADNLQEVHALMAKCRGASPGAGNYEDLGVALSKWLQSENGKNGLLPIAHGENQSVHWIDELLSHRDKYDVRGVLEKMPSSVIVDHYAYMASHIDSIYCVKNAFVQDFIQRVFEVTDRAPHLNAYLEKINFNEYDLLHPMQEINWLTNSNGNAVIKEFLSNGGDLHALHPMNGSNLKFFGDLDGLDSGNSKILVSMPVVAYGMGYEDQLRSMVSQGLDIEAVGLVQGDHSYSLRQICEKKLPKNSFFFDVNSCVDALKNSQSARDVVNEILELKSLGNLKVSRQ